VNAAEHTTALAERLPDATPGSRARRQAAKLDYIAHVSGVTEALPVWLADRDVGELGALASLLERARAVGRAEGRREELMVLAATERVEDLPVVTVAEMAGSFTGGPDSVEWLREQRGQHDVQASNESCGHCPAIDDRCRCPRGMTHHAVSCHRYPYPHPAGA
jgi:hypothetical protein